MFFKHREVTEFNELNVGEYTSYEVIDHENNGSHWGWHICWVIVFPLAWLILPAMWVSRPIVLVKLVGESNSNIYWLNKNDYHKIIETLNNKGK